MLMAKGQWMEFLGIKGRLHWYAVEVVEAQNAWSRVSVLSTSKQI